MWWRLVEVQRWYLGSGMCEESGKCCCRVAVSASAAPHVSGSSSSDACSVSSLSIAAPVWHQSLPLNRTEWARVVIVAPSLECRPLLGSNTGRPSAGRGVSQGMFILLTVRDTIHIPPSAFSSPFHAALLTALHVKYANRVQPNHGLLIAPHTILTPHTQLVAPTLHPTDAGAHLSLTFTVICFQPFPGELLIGRIKASDHSGLLVSLDFYDWVVVAPEHMQQPAVWDGTEGLWLWRYEGHDLYMDIDQPIRIKVVSVQYAKRTDPMVEGAAGTSGGEGEVGGSSGGGSGGGSGGVSVSAKDSIVNYRPAMRVNASIKEDGLGLLTWWD